MIYKNILDTIGNTPIIKINKIYNKKDVNIYAKIEGVNPGGSIKDRTALKMISEAEREGKLDENKTIIEATSGNTGIALAMIGAIRGYKVEIIMSKAVSIERRKMIASFGANIVLTDADKGTDGAIQKARELVAENPDKYFHTDQYSNIYNKLAHTKTAEEIWEQTNGNIDYFVASIGTSGTLMGIGETLKKYNKNIKIVSAEPVEGHYIQGLKNMNEAIMPEIYKKEQLDQIIMVDTEDAYQMSRDIIKKEGIFVGMSSGAAMWASLELAKKQDRGNIVTIFPDRGEKYLSTNLFL